MSAIGTSDALAVDLLKENFDELTLGPVVTFQSEIRSRKAFTKTAPMGPGVQGTWEVDNSAMPAQAIGSDLIGVAEFEGWSFVDRDWWGDTAGDQDRKLFISASGTVAVADSDEWDDFGTPSPASTGFYDSTLRVSAIPLQGIAPNTARLFFHSSWRPEVGNGGSQKASLTVKYNDPAATTIELFRWVSEAEDPNFHAAAPNEAISIPVMNPAGATNATLEFRLFDAGNNWWWAVDNLSLFTGTAPAQDGVLRLVVNRDTQQVKIVNNTAAAINLRGYTVESKFGTLDEVAANFLGEASANWQVLNNPATSELSEGYIPDQYAMPTVTANPTLGEINLGPAWRKFNKDIDDITFQYLVAGSDVPVTGIIEFAGNGGQSFNALDLNFDGQVNLLDYATFLAGYATSLAGKTSTQQYNLGDLNLDGKHTVRDFLQFRQQFDAVRGTGALDAAIAAGNLVPEPATALSLALAIVLAAPWRRRRGTLAAAVLIVALGAASAGAAPLNETFDGVPLFPSVEDNPTPAVWSDVGPVGWKVDRSGVPGYFDPNNNGVKEWAGWNFASKDWWVTTAEDQDRSQFARAAGTLLIADPDEWDDAPHPKDTYYSTYITTPRLDVVSGVAAGQVRLSFDSSWNPEGFDDYILPGQTAPTNNQTATVEVSYNGGPFQNILWWDSQTGGPHFKAKNTNEGIDVSLNYDGAPNTSLKVRIGLTLAANDWWWALDNIRVSNVDVVLPVPPTLRINTTTGMAELVGGGIIPESITGFDISSANGNLAPLGNVGLSFSKPDSVDGPDADSIVGNNIGEGWQLGSANANLFSEFFLDGSSTYMNPRVDSLGRIFDPATPAASRDLQFTYITTSGDVISSPVQYVSTPANADFDADGDVDGADFLRWQRGLGTGTTLAQGDADDDHDVDVDDLAIWKARFGLPPATASAHGVPEPGGEWLAMPLVAGALAATRRTSRSTRRASKALAAAIVAAHAIGVHQLASAQVIPAPFLDRDYRMGENDPGAANGTSVSVTRDNAGQLGMNQLIDMTATNKGGGQPTYVTISGRPDGGTGLGIRLNPNAADKQYLRTGADEALNFPERSPSSTEGTLPGGTLNYLYITDRGFQLWVQPLAATEAHIVMDSNNHGALITPTGKFGMRYSNLDYAGQTTVVPNTWYHLEVVRAFGDRGTGSVLYVNGVAEAAATGIYNGEDAPNDEMNPANHDNSPLVVGSTTAESTFQIGTQKYFRGVVDDLKMFVMGLNPTNDYGEFQFQRDNAYAAFFAPTTAGDLNNDHVINMTDVTTFASNWRKENTLTWTQGGAQKTLIVGDLHSRMLGDFNYDGRVNLADWGILNTANPAMGAAALQLIGIVPEPTSLGLVAALAAVLAPARRWSDRRVRKASRSLRNA
jgi:hypothetical protein